MILYAENMVTNYFNITDKTNDNSAFKDVT